MADSVSFRKTDTTGSTGALALPEYPGIKSENLDQSIQQAMGGRITALTRSSGTIDRWTLHWQNLPEANYTAIKTFFYTTVAGAAEAVHYIDQDATVNTVKYLGGIEDASMVGFELYELEIRLGAAA